MINDINAVFEAAETINIFHKTFSEEWLKNQSDPFNFKKKQIRDICSNNTIENCFYEYMSSYCDSLVRLQFTDDYSDITNKFSMENRVKEPDSRISKILKYNNENAEQGQVNINKCLNDLLGFRIITEGMEYNDITKQIFNDKLANLGIKVHNSCKGDYLAMHLYFSNSNNKFFPWELQIWNHYDAEKNFASHKEYKQGYTKWPSISFRSESKKGE